MLQLHLSDQQFHCLLRCGLYYRFQGTHGFWSISRFMWYIRPYHSGLLCHHSKNRMIAPMYYSDVIMGAMTSQITSFTIVYSIVYSGADKRKYQSSASLAFVRGIHRWQVDSPHQGPVTRKIIPFDDVIMKSEVTWKDMKSWHHKARTLCVILDMCCITQHPFQPRSHTSTAFLTPL